MSSSRSRPGDRSSPAAVPAPEQGRPRKRGGPPRSELTFGLWLLKHTQAIVTTATALGVAYLRTPHAVYYVGGALATSFSAKALKRVFKQARPQGSYSPQTHGMPSTHSATITFMGVYLILCAQYLPIHEALRNVFGEHLPVTAAMCVGAIAPPLVMWSRVRLGLHTTEQTLAGAALGLSTASLWFHAWYRGEARTLAEAWIGPLITFAENIVGLQR